MIQIGYFLKYPIFHENEMSLMLPESFKHERAHAFTNVLAPTCWLTQAKAVSEGRSCKARANFPNMPKNFFI